MNAKIKDAVDRKIIQANIKLVTQNSDNFRENSNWYVDARKWCRELCKDTYTLEQVAGVFSAFSPLKSVEQCKKLTEDFLNQIEVKTIGSQIRKAEAIILAKESSEIVSILNGTKTINFYYSILGTSTGMEVAIDVHMMKLAPSYWGSLTPKRYKMLCNEICEASIGSSYTAQKYQAGLWGTLKTITSVREI